MEVKDIMQVIAEEENQLYDKLYYSEEVYGMSSYSAAISRSSWYSVRTLKKKLENMLKEENK